MPAPFPFHLCGCPHPDDWTFLSPHWRPEQARQLLPGSHPELVRAGGQGKTKGTFIIKGRRQVGKPSVGPRIMGNVWLSTQLERAQNKCS